MSVPLKTTITSEFSGIVEVGVTDGEETTSEEGEFVKLPKYVGITGVELTVDNEYSEDCELVGEKGMGSTRTK